MICCVLIPRSIQLSSLLIYWQKVAWLLFCIAQCKLLFRSNLHDLFRYELLVAFD